MHTSVKMKVKTVVVMVGHCHLQNQKPKHQLKHSFPANSFVLRCFQSQSIQSTNSPTITNLLQDILKVIALAGSVPSAANEVMSTSCVWSQQAPELQLTTIPEPPEDLVGFDAVPQGYDRGDVFHGYFIFFLTFPFQFYLESFILLLLCLAQVETDIDSGASSWTRSSQGISP